MKKLKRCWQFSIISIAFFSTVILIICSPALAARGAGSVEVSNEGPGGIQLRIGAQIRLIPTSETDWDFGMGDAAVQSNGSLGSFQDGSVGAQNQDYTRHANEGGNVGSDYIRGENRLYFRAKQDNLWSFYLATESDTTLENLTVDRGSRGANYGIERLNGAVNLPWIKSWFHAGWDVYHVDIDTSGLVYGDDDPGFWLKGKSEKVGWQLGFHKKIEANGENKRFESNDLDRDLYDLRIDYFPDKNHNIAFFYMYDDFNSFDWISASNEIDSDNSRIGALYKGKLGLLKLALEGAYQFGDIKDLPAASGLGDQDFDVRAFFGWANASLDLSEKVGAGFKPHLAAFYTSGDNDPNDSDLNGYTAATTINRFGQAFRGENTILGDGNGVIGTSLYGWLPEYVGNQSAYLINGGVFSTARADNPGLTALQVGFDLTPAKNWFVRSELAYLRWNEEWMDGADKDLGVEWDNEIRYNFNDVVQFKGQASFFFAGDGVKDRTDYLKDGALDGAGGSDDTLMRFAAELVWVF